MLREHVEAISRRRPAVLPPRKSCLDFACRAIGVHPNERRGAIVKSFIRKSAASGTDRAKIEKLVRRGWQPGLKIGDVLSNRKRRKGVAQDE